MKFIVPDSYNKDPEILTLEDGASINEIFNKPLSMAFYVYYYLKNTLIRSIIKGIRFGRLKTTIANAKERIR